MVRKALRLDRCHILGQGWGGMLALSYLAAEGASSGIASLTLASVPASYKALIEDRKANVSTSFTHVQLDCNESNWIYGNLASLT